MIPEFFLWTVEAFVRAEPGVKPTFLKQSTAHVRLDSAVSSFETLEATAKARAEGAMVQHVTLRRHRVQARSPALLLAEALTQTSLDDLSNPSWAVSTETVRRYWDQRRSDG